MIWNLSPSFEAVAMSGVAEYFQVQATSF